MQIILRYVVLLIIVVQMIAGCGGGGGSTPDPPSTKTLTLKLTSHSVNQAVNIGSFLLKVILPAGFVLQADSNGNVSSSSVFLIGSFDKVVPQIVNYNSVTRELVISYASGITGNVYTYGDFVTIVATVPFGYVPANSDFTFPVSAVWDLSLVRIDQIPITVAFY